jgi:hypothetical protein
MAVGFLGLAVLCFMGAVASVLYFSTAGTYIALGLVVFGSFLMLISAMVRDRGRNPVYSAPKRPSLIEDEETAFGS